MTTYVDIEWKASSPSLLGNWAWKSLSVLLWVDLNYSASNPSLICRTQIVKEENHLVEIFLWFPHAYCGTACMTERDLFVYPSSLQCINVSLHMTVLSSMCSGWLISALALSEILWHSCLNSLGTALW